MSVTARWIGLLSAVLVFAAGCAAQAPIATPTTPPAAAVTPTPTKAPTATPTKRPLTKASIAIPVANLAYLVPFLAQAKGYWVEEGLDMDWVVVGSGAKALVAVTGGSVDFSSNSFPPEVIKAIDAGQKIKAVAVTQQRGVSILTLSKKVADERGVSQKSSLADKGRALKGLTISTFSAGGFTYELLKATLAAANLDVERDVTAMFIADDTARLAAFSRGEIDGFVTGPPAAIQPVAAGEAIVLVSTPAGDLPFTGDMAQGGMLAHEQTISGRAEVVDAALRALWRAERYFHQDVPGSAKALRTLEWFAQIDERAFNMSVEVLQGSVPKEPVITAAQFNDLVRYHNSTVKADEQTKITVQQLFDDGPALRAKKQLGF